jgi:hypothetical protein
MVIRRTYLDTVKNIIVGNEDPESVVLLDVEPFKQNTQIVLGPPEKYWESKLPMSLKY